MFLLAFAGFSWVFGVRGDFCMCFCWLFLGFLRPRRFLYVFLLAFAGFSWVFATNATSIKLIKSIKSKSMTSEQINSATGGGDPRLLSIYYYCVVV